MGMLREVGGGWGSRPKPKLLLEASPARPQPRPPKAAPDAPAPGAGRAHDARPDQAPAPSSTTQFPGSARQPAKRQHARQRAPGSARQLHAPCPGASSTHDERPDQALPSRTAKDPEKRPKTKPRNPTAPFRNPKIPGPDVRPIVRSPSRTAKDPEKMPKTEPRNPTMPCRYPKIAGPDFRPNQCERRTPADPSCLSL